jgi:hypothetical protein
MFKYYDTKVDGKQALGAIQTKPKAAKIKQ